MLERSKKVTNFGRAKFTELVLDLLQLLTFEKLHFNIATIIEQMFSQEGFASTQGNCRHLHIRHANDLIYNRTFSVLQKFLALPIHNKMVVYTKMNCSSWQRLEFMHNIIDSPTIISDAKGRNMKKIHLIKEADEVSCI